MSVACRAAVVGQTKKPQPGAPQPAREAWLSHDLFKTEPGTLSLESHSMVLLSRRQSKETNTESDQMNLVYTGPALPRSP